MKSKVKRPFLNQVEPYITENEIRALNEYMHSGGWLTEFEKTREFERMIADFLGVKHVVVVTSGTVGLYLAALALGIGKGDKVIVPDFTMIASPNSVEWTGGDVDLCDVEADTLCADISELKPQPRTKALMYVSINGRSGNMEEVQGFCKEKGLYLLEDACQAFGSKWGDKYLGTFGDISVFSFTPHKIITTGQGGAVVTNDDELFEKVQKLKDFSRTRPGVDAHTGIGFNFKFTDLQAVVGIEQMKTMDFRMKRKKEIFREYEERLFGERSVNFLPTDLSQTVPWFVDIIQKSSRSTLMRRLRENRIGSRPFYPAIHTQLPYRNHKGNYGVAGRLAPHGLWLPSSIGLTSADIARVSSCVREDSSSRKPPSASPETRSR
jgi:perosamine synthetase